jgi:hypothetical protein
MTKTLRIIGTLAIIFGLIASIFAFVNLYWPAIAVISGFLGFLMSSIYIFINARHQVNTSTFNPGLVGMLLSSVPVIFFFILVLSGR